MLDRPTIVASRPRQEFQHAVVERSESKRHDVAQVVLIYAPGLARPLSGQLVHCPLKIARGEIDRRETLNCWIGNARSARNVAVLLHVVEQATNVVADEVSLERP